MGQILIFSLHLLNTLLQCYNCFKVMDCETNVDVCKTWCGIYVQLKSRQQHCEDQERCLSLGSKVENAVNGEYYSLMWVNKPDFAICDDAGVMTTVECNSSGFS